MAAGQGAPACYGAFRHRIPMPKGLPIFLKFRTVLDYQSVYLRVLVYDQSVLFPDRESASPLGDRL